MCLILANVGYFLWARDLAEAPVTTPRPTSVPTLKLASEGSPARTESLAASASPSVPAAVGDPAPQLAANDPSGNGPPASDAPAGLLTDVKRCVSVGPFRDVSEAVHAATLLRGSGYDPRQRVAEGDVWAGVWVYLPLAASRLSGPQILAKLKGAGIDDAMEMPGPNEGAVISLGLYGESKRAQARVAQAQALGFNPAIADRKRTGNVYWIDIDLKPTDSLTKPADLQDEDGHLMHLEVKGCLPSVAAP